MLNRVVPRQMLSDPRFVLGQHAIKGLKEFSENINVMLCHRSYTNVAKEQRAVLHHSTQYRTLPCCKPLMWF